MLVDIFLLFVRKNGREGGGGGMKLEDEGG